MKILYEIPPVQPENSFVALDIEMYGMDKSRLHRPTTGEFACMSIATDPETIYMITDVKDVEQTIANLRQSVWVIQNAPFDITQLRRYAFIPIRKRLWDTLLIERILWGGYFSKFSLADLIRRYLNIEVDKSLQEKWGDVPDNVKKFIANPPRGLAKDLACLNSNAQTALEYLKYSALDSHYTLQVALKQRKLITPKLFKVWKEIDLPAMWAVLDFKGFAIDVEAWKALETKNKARRDEIDVFLSFNPRSPQQVQKYYKDEYNMVLSSTDKKSLRKIIAKSDSEDAKITAKKILEGRKYSKRASTYGSEFLKDKLEKQDGVNVIHAPYKITGAETGRMSASGIHQIPKRDTLEFRACFIARPGNKLIVPDYSAQEPGVLAFITRDPKLLKIFEQGKDIYIEMARIMFNETITKGSSRRDTMKATILGASYGLTPYGLSERENIPLEEAKELLETFFSSFPVVAKWRDKQRSKRDHVTTVGGRRIWLNPHNYQVENNTLNAPIQGSAADMTKLALGKIHRSWEFDYPFAVVGIVHDEIILDVPKAISKAVASYAEKYMIEAANELCPGVPFRVDALVVDRWSKRE